MSDLSHVTIDQALRDPNLLGAALGLSPTWSTWIAVMRATFGLPLSADERVLFDAVAGGREPPTGRVRELWAVVGRRGGKSRIGGAVASFVAAFEEYGPKLAPGEVGVVLVLAASKSQAATVFNYVKAFFESSPILSELLLPSTSDELRLVGNIAICVHTNSYRTLRGRTLIAAIFDEVSFWRDETTSQPDIETYRAVLPALATTKGMLVGISSPYSQRGLLFQKFQQAYGQDNPDVLVVRGGTATFNSTIDSDVIAQAHRDDPEAAAAEWDGEFRGDLSSYVDRAVVINCVTPGIRERPFVRDYRYHAFCDPSGGQHDSMTLAIAHREGERGVLDAAREVRPPFSPADVCEEFARLLKSYRISKVEGDRYGSGWVQEAFQKQGIRYVHSDRTRSEIFLDFLPMLMSGTAVLLDESRLIGQLSQLERRTTRTGRDQIDHSRADADDVANAVAGALTVAASSKANSDMRMPKPPGYTGQMSDPLEMYR